MQETITPLVASRPEGAGTKVIKIAVTLAPPQGNADKRTTSEPLRILGILLGHRDVSTTMVYTHVLNRGACGVRSPLDR